METTKFEYVENNLVVDELIYDPTLPNRMVVRIGQKHYMFSTIGKTLGTKIKENELQEYKKIPSNKFRRAKQSYDFVISNTIPRDGYKVEMGRGMTAAEFTDLCKKYNLTEDDISDVFEDTKGNIYGKEYSKTYKARQIRLPASKSVLALEKELREMGIQAFSGSPGRLNIKIR